MQLHEALKTMRRPVRYKKYWLVFARLVVQLSTKIFAQLVDTWWWFPKPAKILGSAPVLTMYVRSIAFRWVKGGLSALLTGELWLLAAVVR